MPHTAVDLVDPADEAGLHASRRAEARKCLIHLKLSRASRRCGRLNPRADSDSDRAKQTSAQWPSSLSRKRRRPASLLLAEKAPDHAPQLDGAAGSRHIVAASRGLRLLLPAAPALPAAGEADDRARTMVSVA